MNDQQLTFVNNQSWLLVYDMSQWAALYDFSKAVFRMQVRRRAGDAQLVYTFASYQLPGVQGSITYDSASQLMLISASYADARSYFLAGSYAFDLTIEIVDPISLLPLIVRDLARGTIVVSDGVTLR